MFESYINCGDNMSPGADPGVGKDVCQESGHGRRKSAKSWWSTAVICSL